MFLHKLCEDTVIICLGFMCENSHFISVKTQPKRFWNSFRLTCTKKSVFKLTVFVFYRKCSILIATTEKRVGQQSNTLSLSKNSTELQIMKTFHTNVILLPVPALHQQVNRLDNHVPH